MLSGRKKKGGGGGGGGGEKKKGGGGGEEIQFKRECVFHFCSELITCGAADRHLAC